MLQDQIRKIIEEERIGLIKTIEAKIKGGEILKIEWLNAYIRWIAEGQQFDDYDCEILCEENEWEFSEEIAEDAICFYNEEKNDMVEGLIDSVEHEDTSDDLLNYQHSSKEYLETLKNFERKFNDWCINKLSESEEDTILIKRGGFNIDGYTELEAIRDFFEEETDHPHTSCSFAQISISLEDGVAGSKEMTLFHDMFNLNEENQNLEKD